MASEREQMVRLSMVTSLANYFKSCRVNSRCRRSRPGNRVLLSETRYSHLQCKQAKGGAMRRSAPHTAADILSNLAC